MMGRRSGDQASLSYEFRLDDRIPKNHLLRGFNAFVTAAAHQGARRLATSATFTPLTRSRLSKKQRWNSEYRTTCAAASP
jgi:hypothetical protein